MRRVVKLAIAMVLTAAISVTGCGDDPDDSSSTTTVPSTTRPAATDSTTSPISPTTTDPDSAVPSTTEPDELTTVRVYWMAGEHLQVSRRSVAAGTAPLRQALSVLFDGPTGAESGDGLSTAVPEGTQLLGVTIADGTATIDVTGAFGSGGGSLSMFSRLAQLTYTATQFESVQRVQLRVDGVDADVFGTEGIVLDGPLTRTDAVLEDALAAIVMDTPVAGDTVSNSFTASGTSNTFEATHRIEVLGPAGAVLYQNFVTATSGTGTRGTWTHRVTLPGDVDGPVTVRVYEPSAEDGRPLHQLDVPINVG